MPVCFYVHIPSAKALEPFLIQIFWRFNRMIKPSGLMLGLRTIWVADWNLSCPIHSRPPARCVNLQAVFNEMSPLRRGPRPRGRACLEDTSWAERSFRFTEPVSWPTLQSLRGSIPNRCESPTGERDGKRLVDKRRENVTKEGKVWRMCRGKRSKSEVKEDETAPERVWLSETQRGVWRKKKQNSGVIDVLWKEGKVLFDAGT